MDKSLIFKLFASLLFIISPTSAQRSSSFGINVPSSDVSAKITAVALNDIFADFPVITSAANKNLAVAVSELENNIRTVETVLLAHQNDVSNTASNIREKVDDTQLFDTSGALKAPFDDIVKFTDAVQTIADFASVNRRPATVGDVNARIAAAKSKYNTYLQLQLTAAKNSSIVGVLAAKMSAAFEKIFETASEDFVIEISILDATLQAMRSDLLLYSTALSTATMKLVTLTSDMQLLNEGCTFSLPCGTFLPYEPSKDVDAPRRNGFRVGRYWNGHDVFVGAGWTRDGYYTPGRLMIGNSGPGVYMETGYEERDTTTADYLLNHRSLQWVAMTWKGGARFPDNSIYVNNPIFSYGIGRYMAPSGTAYIGKVMHAYGFYYSANGSSYSAKNIEILTCAV